MMVSRQVWFKYGCRESSMDIFLLIIPIIFKLMNSKVLFLFVLILALEVNTQVLSPTSQCLGNCSNCDLLSLTSCRSPLPCQWGFYDPFKNGTCVQTPSTQTLVSQLGQRTNKSMRFVASGWSGSARQAVCEYPSASGIQFIDVLGMFSGVEMMEKTFKVGENVQLLELSFNMLHTEWLPFNDFLIVDLSSNNKNIATLEISYETRVQVSSQIANITCEGKRVLNNKYSIKIINDANIKGNLTVIFTSFLFSSSWGLANLKLVQGCTGYSMYNAASQKCNLCDKNAFVVKSGDSQWCEICPSLCRTCESASKCLTCVSGAAVDATGLCSFGDTFKTQLVPINSSTTFCDSIPIFLGTSSTPITLPSLKNDNSLLYDEVQVGFYLYYTPSQWQSAQSGAIIVKLNQVEIMKLTNVNLTNKGTTNCNSFQKAVARMEIFSGKVVHNDNVVGLSVEVVGNGVIGVGNVRVKSIKKNQQPAPVSNNSAVSPPNTTVPSSNTSSPIANNTSSPVVNNTVPPANSTPAANTSTPVNNSSTPTNNSSNPIVNITVPTITNNTSPQTQVPLPTSTNSTIIDHISQSKPTSPVTPSQLIPSETQTPQIAFLPALSNKKSGIQVYITGQPTNTQNYYTVSIDKLTPDQYAIDSYFIQDNKLNMFITVNKSFTSGVVSVYRNAASARLLQGANSVLVGNFPVQRFDPISQKQANSVESFSLLFEIAAWAGAYLIIIAVLSGYGIVVEEYILALQVLFLHVYIAADYIPLTFRDSIGGLNLIENLNFFAPSHSQAIEHQWMGNVVQNGPVRFYLYNTDINFLRQFFPIIIINIVYLIWFGIVFIARKRVNKDLIDEEKGVLHKFLDNVGGRAINFVDQIWRYQFLATVWACFVQFYNFAYPENSDRSQAINTAICVLAFLCTLAWPAFVSFYTLKQYYECEYSEYLYNFEDLYYMKIPEYQLPSIHHRMGYPLLKAAKTFILVLAVCYFGNIASLALVCMVLLHVVELIYLKLEGIYNNKVTFIMKFIENGLFILIDTILLGLLNFSSLAVSESYVYIGFILAGLAFLLIVNGLARVGYMAHSKYKKAIDEAEEWMVREKKPKTERVV